VHVAPDKSNIPVFKSGISQGLSTSIPVGGQIQPTDKAGERLQAKKSPKKGEKKHNF